MKLLYISFLLIVSQSVAAIKPENNNLVELLFTPLYLLSQTHALGLFRLYLFKDT